MSDIQRWAPFDPMALMGRHPNGAFVTYADHVAAVAAAKAESYADGRVDGMRDVADLCYQRGVKAAREAVVSLPNWPYSNENDSRLCAIDEALAAIDKVVKP